MDEEEEDWGVSWVLVAEFGSIPFRTLAEGCKKGVRMAMGVVAKDSNGTIVMEGGEAPGFR